MQIRELSDIRHTLMYFRRDNVKILIIEASIYSAYYVSGAVLKSFMHIFFNIHNQSFLTRELWSRSGPQMGYKCVKVLVPFGGVRATVHRQLSPDSLVH